MFNNRLSLIHTRRPPRRRSSVRANQSEYERTGLLGLVSSTQFLALVDGLGMGLLLISGVRVGLA